MKRLSVEFQSGKGGDKCRAWLYLPESGGPLSVVVMAHGLGGIKEMRLDAYAERFAGAGYACLAFDYRHFGESDGEPRQLLDIRRQQEDWRSAIAFARRLADSGQIVLWGTSFGGGHVIHAAAHERGIAAAIAQCPFTDGIASALAMDIRSSLKVTAVGIADLVKSLFGWPPLMVATAGPPHSTALMTAPDAESGYLQLAPSASRFKNHVAARFALNIIRCRPGRQAAKAPCPILFCICETDTVAPAGATLRYARKAPKGEIRNYPFGHFDIYVGGAFEQAVSDQIEFLKRHVPVQRQEIG
jgi:dienelactone hydrolase